MNVSMISETSVPLSSWAGGTSREYYIYPPAASYGEKNFLVRLSSAASHDDTPSRYTDLPGITRYLIILEGTAKISHEGHHSLIMNPYDPVDVFDGAWKTVSQGKVTDFNLMLGRGAEGRMELIEHDMDIPLNHPNRVSHEWLGFFCAAGMAVINMAEKSFNLQKGDLLLLENFSAELSSLRISILDGKLIRLDACLSIS
ncbi:MAG: HutD family protein [Treponema sp.]|jgi:environmental stress-induced protein Ves|nr:HutD family protein [Treponema sp.]